MGLELPINAALALYITYSGGKLVFPPVPQRKSEISHDPNASYNWAPKAHPPTVLFRTYTPKELAVYNGEGGARILLAISGRVFDVTAGRSFYGPGKQFRVLST